MTRVLQVVTHMNRGGLETMLMNYYRNMDRTQIQFDFLTHRPYEGDYAEEIRQLGGVVYHLPVLNPFSLHYRKLLGQFFDEHPEYQIIHVHQDCLSSVILSIAMQHGVRVRIAHCHSASQDKDIKYPIKLFYRRFIPKYATDLMACGRDAGEWMFRGAGFRILNNAIDTGVYTVDYEKRKSLRKQLGIEADEFVVGHVGRFSPPKNHSFLIDIYYQIKQIEPKARLLLVGKDTGENANRIKEKVQTLQLQDSVTFAGLRPDVADLLQTMDVFVFPSVYEGLPVTLVEAQAAGLPCLISDKVPIECKVTGLVQQIPLSAGAEVWAKAVIETGRETVREDTSAQIKAAGFDIVENAKWLQEYYTASLKKT